MGKNIVKNISINLSAKYNQKLLNNAKQSVTGAFKTVSKTAIEKPADGTGDFIRNKIADKIRKVSKLFK